MPSNSEEGPAASGKLAADSALQRQVEEEEKQIERHPLRTLLSGLSAGLDLGFGPFFMAVVLTLTHGAYSEPTRVLLAANAYAIGYIFVILGGSELFTEHTTLAVFTVLDRRASVRELLRLWGLIYAGNLAGATLFAALGALIGPALHIIEFGSSVNVARELLRHSWWATCLSGALTGWMLGLVAWLVASGRDTISQVFFIWIVAAGIGLARLHHSIAGTVEVLMPLFAGQPITWGEYLEFLLWATLGNAVGGVFFVALIKYGYVSQSTSVLGHRGRRP
jgi:formate/nitrite transporter FocA (FNT family)